MKRLLILLFVLPGSMALAQTTPLDCEWRGRSDGGSCNAPLDFQLSIESGIVDGTASDPSARGPVPNLKRTEPPPPTPGLWQIHGVAKGGSFSLMTLASVKGTDRRSGKLNVTTQGAGLVVSESGGCGRKATLSKN